MVVVGLTGGIGSGKSTVSRLLAERGAVIIDSDVVARGVVAPGTSTLDAVVERFGPAVLSADGALDRASLAGIVFSDDAAREELNAIVHPAVFTATQRHLAEAAEHDPDAVVVLDVPLLAEVGPDRYPICGVIVVDAPAEAALARLLAARGLREEDARARMRSQVSRAERMAIADLVIDNSGDLDHLRSEVDRAWAWIERLVVTAGS